MSGVYPGAVELSAAATVPNHIKTSTGRLSCLTAATTTNIVTQSDAVAATGRTDSWRTVMYAAATTTGSGSSGVTEAGAAADSAPPD